MKVLKFGGTSVYYHPDNILNILKREYKKNDSLVIVLSALSQITNLLVAITKTTSIKDKLFNFNKLKLLHTHIERVLHLFRMPCDPVRPRSRG